MDYWLLNFTTNLSRSMSIKKTKNPSKRYVLSGAGNQVKFLIHWTILAATEEVYRKKMQMIVANE